MAEITILSNYTDFRITKQHLSMYISAEPKENAAYFWFVTSCMMMLSSIRMAILLYQMKSLYRSSHYDQHCPISR